MKPRALAVLAWLPLALCVAIAVYLNVQYPEALGSDPMRLVSGTLKAALDGHWNDLAVLVVVATAVSLAVGIVFVNHMAKRTDLGAKVLWIVGAIFVAPVVLPIYALRKLKAA
ncbi:MAG: hypothetical protein JNL83_39870 [Myxococcales bacterium]|nr:hypothetical protein [Myxococcales bacterium]